MNEELDSQLSAMFDDELPTSECELLARRLSRDEALKARWGRYAVVGAVIRAERGVRLNAPLAGRVNALISVRARARRRRGAVDPAPRTPGLVAAARRGGRWPPAWPPFRCCGCAPRRRCRVAALSARATPPVAVPVAKVADSYVVPPTPAVRPMVVPSTELANYVVAHSMVSSPVARRNLLSSFITSEPAAA